MSNARASNVWDVNATGALTAGKGQRVTGVIVTSTNTNASLILKESNSGSVKFRWDIAASNTSNHIYLLDTPIFFSQDIYVATLTNCVAQIILDQGLGG
jgi:hypothetical protein